MKKRKMDEQYLWAELQGNEAIIKEILNRNGEIRTQLNNAMIKKERLRQAAGEVS